MTAGRITSDGREAPVLLVGFRCPAKDCGAHALRDAYAGPVSCATGHAKTFMTPLGMLDHLSPDDRLACIDAEIGFVPAVAS